MKVWLLTLVSLLALLTAANAGCTPSAKKIAENITAESRVLVKFTKIACVNTLDNGKCSILCFSDLNITGFNRNLILTFLVGTAGKKFLENDVRNFGSINFADLELIGAKHALALSASKASLLSPVKERPGETLEAMVERTAAEFKTTSFSRP